MLGGSVIVTRSMQSKYVQARDGNVYAGKGRVTLDTIVLNWRGGSSPVVIHEDFPTVPLATVYGAIAYYLEHKEEMDQHLRDNEELWRSRRSAEEAADPEFYAGMRQRLTASRRR